MMLGDCTGMPSLFKRQTLGDYHAFFSASPPLGDIHWYRAFLQLPRMIKYGSMWVAKDVEKIRWAEIKREQSTRVER